MANKRIDLTTAELVARLRANEEFAAAWDLQAPKITLAANIARLRHARGLTQQQLADAAGMRQPRVAEIERGIGNPQLETLTRIAHALGVKIGELLAEEPVLSASADTRVRAAG